MFNYTVNICPKKIRRISYHIIFRAQSQNYYFFYTINIGKIHFVSQIKIWYMITRTNIFIRILLTHDAHTFLIKASYGEK